MTPQLVILKIQSLLARRSEMSFMDRRALAMEYSRLCAQVQSDLEHCVAMIKSGREYAALQVAESSGLLDAINVLTFAELPAWREFCEVNDYPVTQPFDETQVGLVMGLYSRGITQAHPLYRDYRRAMRLHRFDEALGVIRTITRINSYDAEARSEYARLRKFVANKKLDVLLRALRESDEEKVARLCDELEPEAEIISDDPVWQEALSFRKKAVSKLNAQDCSKIISELKNLDVDSDWERAIELISEFNMKKGDFTPASDIEFADSVLSKSAEIQNRKLTEERSARACNAIAALLENPQGSRRERIKTLESLISEAGEGISPTLEKRAKSKIIAMKIAQRIAFWTVFGASAAAVLAVCGFIWFTHAQNERRKITLAAEAELSSIESLDSYSALSRRIADFEKIYASILSEPSIASRLSAAKQTVEELGVKLGNLEKKLASFEKLEWNKLASADLLASRKDLSEFEKSLKAAPRRESLPFDERISALAKRANSAVSERKREISREFRALLDSFKAEVSKYVSGGKPNAALESKIDSIRAAMSNLVSDELSELRPSASDVAAYGDAAVKMDEASSKFEAKSALESALASARTPADYVKALTNLKNSASVSASEVSRITAAALESENISPAFLSQFGSPLLASAPTSNIPFSKGVLPPNPMFDNVYKYLKGGNSVVYTSGKVSERTQKWEGGSEIMQEANQIGLGGKISNSVYRLNNTRGRAPRGEILTGGNLSAESELAASAAKIASDKSLIAALDFVRASNVDPVFKALIERAIFRKMEANPAESGLLYSPSAAAHKSKLDKVAGALFDYSWVFENPSRRNLIKSELYSGQFKPYADEAERMRRAVGIAKGKMPKFIGYVDASGTNRLFAKPTGAIWAIDGATGKLSLLGNNKPAPYSPIFSEQASFSEILKQAESAKK